MGLPPGMVSYIHRQFPTLLGTLPRTARSLPGASLVVAKRLQRGMTRRRMIAVGFLRLRLGLVELPRVLIEVRDADSNQSLPSTNPKRSVG